MQFVFKPEDLQAILDTKPAKVLFTIKIEGEVLKSGEKVGVVRIDARGTYRKGQTAPRDPDRPGCPIPPCLP